MRHGKTKKVAPSKEQTEIVHCAHCGKEYKQSGYSALCDVIMRHKPACSYECNKALGQAT